MYSDSSVGRSNTVLLINSGELASSSKDNHHFILLMSLNCHSAKVPLLIIFFFLGWGLELCDLPQFSSVCLSSVLMVVVKPVYCGWFVFLWLSQSLPVIFSQNCFCYVHLDCVSCAGFFFLHDWGNIIVRCSMREWVQNSMQFNPSMCCIQKVFFTLNM